MVLCTSIHVYLDVSKLENKSLIRKAVFEYLFILDKFQITFLSNLTENIVLCALYYTM